MYPPSRGHVNSHRPASGGAPGDLATPAVYLVTPGMDERLAATLGYDRGNPPGYLASCSRPTG